MPYFSYYRQVESEATTMITGLGKYVLKQYGKPMAAQMFTADHFRAIKGWRYDIMTGLFRTPEMRQIKSNLKFDNNLKAINILQELQQEEEKKLEAEKKKNLDKAMLLKQRDERKQLKKSKTAVKEAPKNTSSNRVQVEEDSTVDMAEYIENAELVDLTKKREDSDLDSLNEQYHKKVNEIFVSDNHSITSGLTDGSNQSEVQSKSDISEDTYKSNNTNHSKSIINQKVIKSIINDSTLTDEEIRDKVEKYHCHQFQKAQISYQSQVEEFLQSRTTTKKTSNNATTNTNVTKNKGKKHKRKNKQQRAASHNNTGNSK